MTEDKKNMSRRSRYANTKPVSPGGSLSRNIKSSSERISKPKERVESSSRRTTARPTSSSSEPRRTPSSENVRRTSEVRRSSRVQGEQEKVRQNIGASGGPSNNKPPRPRISRVNTKAKKKKIWPILLKYGLYLGSIAVIAVFSLCVFWISQAPDFNSDILDNNHRTIVYDINDKEVAKLGSEIGDNATKEEVPQQMQDAILATEDNRFFEHGAVDYKRLVGAVFSNLTSGFGSQGGSTISQQLIKRTFLDENKSIKRKVQEAYLAYKLEQNYDKETIFNMYINRIYYSDGVYGLKTAANYYYGKELGDLSLPQMALLAGLPQQPNSYNPYDYPDNAKSRRDTVLYLMQYHGKITEEEAIAAQQTDIMSGIVKRNANERFILSSQFDADYTAYMSQVASELRNSPEYKNYDGDVLNLGLKVYTNLDTSIQDNISTSMNNNVAGIRENSDVSMVVLNNENSGISAIYGGRDFKYGGFNIATQSKLQPGSAIKPIFAYAPAVEYLGWATNHMIEDTQIPGTQIQNWDRQFHGNVTINYALMMSFNIPTIKTYQQVGFSNVQQYAKNVGMALTDDSITAPIGGSSDGYSPLQMAGAYVPFSNGGYYATPKTIRKVYDNEGQEVSSFSQTDRKQVIKDSTAYIMTSMLRNVASGTGQSAAVAGIDMGLKTGTTTFSVEDAEKYGFDINNAAKDSWVVGYTSKYTLAVWQGFNKIDAKDTYLTAQDTVKTQVLYRINMQNISRIYPPGSFSVPSNVGTYNGGLKVLTEEEKRKIAEEEEAERKKAEEEKKKEEEKNSSNNNNSSNTTTNNSRAVNSNTANNNNNSSNNSGTTNRTNG